MRAFQSISVVLALPSLSVLVSARCVGGVCEEVIGRVNPSSPSAELLHNLNVTKADAPFAGGSTISIVAYRTNYGMPKRVDAIFDQPVSTEEPLGMFRRMPHPVSRYRVLDPADLPINTNGFYTNHMIDDTIGGSHTLPYMMTFVKDDNPRENPNRMIGMVVSQPEQSDVSLGGLEGNRARFYINPIALKDVVFSSPEFSSATLSRTIDRASQFGVRVHVHANRACYGTNTKRISFPLVQGMGFATAQYDSLLPEVGFDRGIYPGGFAPAVSPQDGMQKFSVRLESPAGFKFVWVLYVIPDDGASFPEWAVSGDQRRIRASRPFQGVLQVAKLPQRATPAMEAVFDSSAGCYPATANLSGSVDGGVGSYTLAYQKEGRCRSGKLLTFLLPHHVESLDAGLRSGLTVLKHRSFTKGPMEAFVGNSVTMHESMPVNASFFPYAGKMDKRAIPYIVRAATDDLADMAIDTNTGSVYFDGKHLGRKANALLAFASTAVDPAMARKALEGLKRAMAVWTSNQQKFPLVYDTAWKGLVSSAALVLGDRNADFGGPYYNDHHFHYGYHIYVAAVIVHCDWILNRSTSWLEQNKSWVNSLVRDVANPSTKDAWYPTFRAFDWYHGHSWAKGLYASYDGKDQESTSEDYNFAFSMKLWGMVTGDAAMEARGNLMLGILRKTVNAYFLLSKDNKNHPPEFVQNMVTGILFENKVDYATYFGNRTEFIHGIQMLPQTAISAYMRPQEFVKAEWAKHFDNGRAEQAYAGWKSILMANYAMVNPGRAFEYFSQDDFQPDWMDGGLTRTWCLAYAAMMEYGQREVREAASLSPSRV